MDWTKKVGRKQVGRKQVGRKLGARGGRTPPSRVHVCYNTYRAIAAVIANPIFAKGGELPQEINVSYKRVSHFHHLFLHGFHAQIFLFATSIDSVCTHERIAKFLQDSENGQNWIQDVFLSSFFLLRFLYPHLCSEVCGGAQIFLIRFTIVVIVFRITSCFVSL